jgi:hypothetical protein
MKKSLLLILSLLLISSFAISCDDDDDSNNETPYCGDGECNNGETSTTCATDCPVDPWCGDGTCNGTETLTSCATDCFVATCGDGTCNGDETLTTCATDCTPSIAIEDFADVAYTMLCEQSMKCEGDIIMQMMDDSTECKMFQLATDDFLGAMVDLVNGGTVIYDGEAAYACIEEMRAMNCAEYNNAPSGPNCDEMFNGTISADASCNMHDECIDGYCSSCTCKAFIGDSADCSNPGDQCFQGSQCINDICVPFADWIVENGDCSNNRDRWCVDGLYCNRDNDKCETLKTEDATCNDDGESNECAFPLGCLKDATGTKVCTVITIHETLTDSCDYDADWCDVFDGLSCAYDYEAEAGTCVNSPIASEICMVEDATGTLFRSDCIPYHYCAKPTVDATESICVARKALNVACDADNECLSWYCDAICKEPVLSECY